MKLKIAALLTTVLLLSACSEPLPDAKQHYAGDWQSREMSLLILSDGTVNYHRLQHGGETTITGPLQEFQGDSFVVGIGPFNTTFEVSEPPTQVGAQWQMVVDGVRLTRIDE